MQNTPPSSSGLSFIRLNDCMKGYIDVNNFLVSLMRDSARLYLTTHERRWGS